MAMEARTQDFQQACKLREQGPVDEPATGAGAAGQALVATRNWLESESALSGPPEVDLF